MIKKYEDFISKLITMTNDNKLRWGYFTDNNIADSFGLAEASVPTFDTKNSFILYDNSKGAFIALVAPLGSSDLELAILTNSKADYLTISGTEYLQSLTILSNIIKNKLLTPEEYIDEFLKL